MNRQTIAVAAVVLLLVGAVVGGILFSTRKNRVELNGSVLRVRSQAVDPENVVVLADIRVNNPSTQQFVVKEVDVYLDDVKGDNFSEMDAKRLFEFYPVLGQKYNPNLIIRQKINPGESIDRMVSVRLAGTEEAVRKRKSLRIVVTDVDGAKTEISEKL